LVVPMISLPPDVLEVPLDPSEGPRWELVHAASTVRAAIARAALVAARDVRILTHCLRLTCPLNAGKRS
jgi:hypothetical protein